MKKNQFLEFLKDNILTLFTGSEIIGEEVSSPRDNCVAQGEAGSIKVKFSKQDNYRIIIKRAQPFKNFEVHLIQIIIDEMSKINQLRSIGEYKQGLESMIIEKAICKSLTNSSSKTLSQVLNMMAYWSQRTYESKKISFGCIVTRKKQGKTGNSNLHISKVLSKDFSALLTDGENSFVEISSDGYVTDYISYVKQFDYNLYAPYKQLKLATLATGSKIGVCLTYEGDVLIFKEKSLLFAKRSGNWVCYSHEEIVDKLSERAREYEDVRKSIYLSALDTSFNRYGGCIVHVNSSELPNVLRHIDDADVLDKESYDTIQEIKRNKSLFSDFGATSDNDYEEFLKTDKCIKATTLRKLIAGRKFQDIDRKFRQDMIAMDGANIIG
ncbi:MAG: hypothetical protein IJX17_08545 [Clostridia bacterium]|nr:hypothetical protein [Clostridia bacterium]